MTDIHEQLKNLSPEKRALLELMLKEKGVDVLGTKILPQGRASNKFPLSFGQQRLWFLDQLDPGTPLYNNPAAVILKGNANIAALEKALNIIVQRHEVLRTTFATENDQPIQVIQSDMPIKLEQVDLRHLPAAEREAAAMNLAKEKAQLPFDLSTGPLFRVSLMQLAEQEYLMLLVMHHIVSDGWSLSIFIQEVAILYKVLVAGLPSPLPELSVQYADFAVWQRQWMQGRVLEEQLAYWRQQLAGAPPVLNLPLDHPRPSYQTTHGATYFFNFSSQLRQAIEALAKKEDVTRFMIYLTAFDAFLYRITQQDDICVGTPIAGRNRKETESLIGFFVNTLVMRTQLSGNPTVRELLKRVKTTAVGAYEHQDIPFETLVEKLQPERDMAISPFFQVMFVHLDTTAQTLRLPDITIEPRPIDSGTAKFDLTFVIEENEEKLAGQIVYNTDLFEHETIERMAAQFQILFDGLVKDVEQRIADLPLLSDREQAQIVERWSRAPQEFHVPQSQSIAELFENQAKQTPNEIALIYEKQTLIYAELNERANRLAHYLMDHGAAPEKLIGICLEQPIDMIVSLLAIFKAGAAYLPLDPAYPKERLALMIEDSAVSLIVTEQNLLASLPENNSQKICLQRDGAAIAKKSKKNPKQRAAMENLAYVIYTSGSTGKPKGVMISHGALADHCLNMRDYYGLQPSDHVLEFASMNFDASLEQILPPLIAGAKLVLRGSNIWSPAEFQQNLAEYGLTVVNPPTAYWNQLLREWDHSEALNKNGQLRLFIVGGDLMSAENLQLWNKTGLNSAKLLNAYGPTEATITSTTFEVPADFMHNGLSLGVPIGKPTALRHIYILDEFFNPVPIGVPGELYIGGDCLARGYLNRADLTAEKFIPDALSQKKGARLYRTGDLARFLPDGNIEFLGRVDHQVKVRGYRIELGEIETLLSQHPAIEEAVVVARAEQEGDKRLVAYFVPRAEFKDKAPSSSELRNYLKENLPDYMVPGIFMAIDQMPRTPIGKIDRKALPVPDQDRPELAHEYVAPRNPVEQMIADLWAKTIGIEKVGIYDNFFDLGGHSLMATQIISRLRNTYNVEIPLRKLFEAPTVANLAMVIAEAQAAQVSEEELGEMLDELEGLSEEEVEKLLGD